MDGIKELSDRGNEEDEGREGDRDGGGEGVLIALLDDETLF